MTLGFSLSSIRSAIATVNCRLPVPRPAPASLRGPIYRWQYSFAAMIVSGMVHGRGGQIYQRQPAQCVTDDDDIAQKPQRSSSSQQQAAADAINTRTMMNDKCAQSRSSTSPYITALCSVCGFTSQAR